MPNEAASAVQLLSTNKAKLLALAEACEKAEGASLILERDIALLVYPGAKALPTDDSRISVWDGNGRTQLTVKPYSASLDAAMTLVPEGLSFEVRSSGIGDKGQATVWDPMTQPGFRAWGEWRVIGCTTPALALCAAALRALAHP